MPSISVKPKPSNATYLVQVDLDPEGQFVMTPAELGQEHAFGQVNIAWYGDDRIKITLKGAGPAVIRQAFLPGTGKDVIVDLIALPGGDA